MTTRSTAVWDLKMELNQSVAEDQEEGFKKRTFDLKTAVFTNPPEESSDFLMSLD